MVKRFLFTVLLLTTCAVSASAYEFEDGGLYYKLNSDGKSVTVTKYSNSYIYYFPKGNVTIPSSVSRYSVTSIGDGAFYKCTDLTSVTIPNSVTSIGRSAFSGCTSLTTIIWNAKSCIFPDYDYKDINYSAEHPFYSYSCPITNLTIGNEVESLPNWFMYNQWRLTSVTIPNSVTSIGYAAFYKCTGLTSVTWNAKNCKDFSSGPFNGIGIKSFMFGSEVEKIPAYLCFNTGVRRVTIPNSVTSIGDGAFLSCTDLTSVTIPNSVTSIGSWAFQDCTSLTRVTIPNSVTSIGNSAFRYCYGLTSATIGKSVTSIGNSAFEDCSGLTSVTIPNSVTSIGDGAFRGCSGLTSVTIPNSVTSIVSWAFQDCTSLTSVTIPNSVTTIGVRAFNGCSGLTSLTIPRSVTAIGNSAFFGCTGLKRIDAYPNPAKVSMDGGVFYNVPKDGTLHVLPKYLSAYQKASQWKDFYNIKADLTETDGIEEVSIDEIDRTLPMNVYNMNGVKVGDSLEGLPAGIYIVHQGSKSAKVMK